MPPHTAFFWGTVFFLSGVLLRSFFPGSVVILAWSGIFVLLAVVFGYQKIKFRFLALSILVVFGGLYYFVYDAASRPAGIPFGIEREALGRVVSVHHKLTYQNAVLELSEPFEGKVSAMLPLYPEVSYGDEVKLKGKISKPETREFGRVLLRDNVFATMVFPDVLDVREHGGFSVMRMLYGISEYTDAAFSRVLPPEEAALMSGIVLGNTDGFTKEFKEDMRRSGTTHIVALSGYNVTVIAASLLSLLGVFMKRRRALVVALLSILGFVLMTGASASVVRAAIMASLLVYLTIEGRLRDPKQIVVFTALLMTLWNPRVLAFDAGFQLSFLALLGILYIPPLLKSALGWRERNLSFAAETALATLSAQITTTPFILAYFGVVFGSSVFANVIVLWLLPPAMALGFCIFLFSFLFPPLAYVSGFFAVFLLSVESWVIQFFSRYAFLGVSMEAGVLFVLAYYVALGVLFAYGKKRFPR